MLEASRYLIKEVDSVFENFMSHMAHQEMLGKECVIASLKEEETAWLFVYFPEDEGNEWHRLHTSTVSKIETECKDIIIYTENTRYVLSSI